MWNKLMTDKRIRLGVSTALVGGGTVIYLVGANWGIIPMIAGLLLLLCQHERPKPEDYLK